LPLALLEVVALVDLMVSSSTFLKWKEKETLIFYYCHSEEGTKADKFILTTNPMSKEINND